MTDAENLADWSERLAHEVEESEIARRGESARDDAGAAPIAETSNPGRDPGTRHLLFSLGPTRLAALLDQLVEVREPLPVTWLPNVPGWILGLMNLRGDIIPLIDLPQLLGLGAEPAERDAKLLVVRSDGDEARAGFAISGVHGVRSFDASTLEEPEEALKDCPSDVCLGATVIDGVGVGVIDFSMLLLGEALARLDSDRSDTALM